ncbi:MAG: aspartate dehydrogenase [Truepera sp.]|jgi:aspartate dehydrogenase|nr:aspartate dehydrogenase [Truepera sp.]HRN18416.1 aspartate dehydrogenase [Trueperaceae bacterium]HRP48055.1 aspartate dehydrogenase [Trueperaceae bacterium]
MRVGLLGAGTISQLVLQHLQSGDLEGAEVVALMGRSEASKGKGQAERYRIPFVTGIDEFMSLAPDVVVEAASHEALEAYGERILKSGASLIVLSAGALANDALRQRLENAARTSRALLYIPSGGIGGLDAIKTAVLSGAKSVTFSTSKPPIAWKDIDYVEQLGVDLDGLVEPYVLFEGMAREAVKHFPQNVNIAAILSLAGIGFDRTRVRVVADPGVKYNTHTISAVAETGNIKITFENVASPDNPKTAWLACYSALAALREIHQPVRYGT